MNYWISIYGPMVLWISYAFEIVVTSLDGSILSENGDRATYTHFLPGVIDTDLPIEGSFGWDYVALCFPGRDSANQRALFYGSL